MLRIGVSIAVHVAAVEATYAICLLSDVFEAFLVFNYLSFERAVCAVQSVAGWVSRRRLRPGRPKYIKRSILHSRGPTLVSITSFRYEKKVRRIDLNKSSGSAFARCLYEYVK